MKDLIQEGREIQQKFKTKVVMNEGIFSDLAWAVKSDIGNAIMGKSSPGRQLFNMWKDGDLYKDPKSPYSKSVSWYDEGKIKSKAMEYDAADKQTFAAMKKLGEMKDKICSNPKNPTPEDQKKMASNKEYLTLYMDYLQKEIVSNTKLHELELAMGKKAKDQYGGFSIPIYDDTTGNYKGETMDRETLLKNYPKEWVDEMELDQPAKISGFIESWKEKIEAAKKQLESL
jgi:hypothetical protein